MVDTFMFPSPPMPHRALSAIALPELLVMFAVVITLWGMYRLRH